MTLCIGALCDSGNGEVLVVASDARVENNIAWSDNQVKLAWATSQWIALVAGPIYEATELLSLYSKHLEGRELTPSEVLTELRIPVRIFRERMADSVCYQLVSLSYREFLEHGKNCLSDEMHRHVENQVSVQRVDVQLILAGVMRLPNDKPRISLYLCADGDVKPIKNFATIGSGSTIAESALYQRDQSAHTHVSRTLYNVYEAMRFGESAPGVGPCQTVAVMRPAFDTTADRPQCCFVFDRGNGLEEKLEEYYVRYGPKDVPDILLFPGFSPNRDRFDSKVLETAYTEANAEAHDSESASGEEWQTKEAQNGV